MEFFDSHGNLHITCDASDHGAGAFGPTGISRQATAEEVAALGLDPDSPWRSAVDAGRVQHADPEDCTTWDVLS